MPIQIFMAQETQLMLIEPFTLPCTIIELDTPTNANAVH